MMTDSPEGKHFLLILQTLSLAKSSLELVGDFLLHRFFRVGIEIIKIKNLYQGAREHDY